VSSRWAGFFFARFASPTSFTSHVRKAMTKLKAETRTAAVATALRLALIP
jgi:DNA-binding CsgD family transcriptional regulator